jgi:hypothetical protein
MLDAAHISTLDEKGHTMTVRFGAKSTADDVLAGLTGRIPSSGVAAGGFAGGHR